MSNAPADPENAGGDPSSRRSLDALARVFREFADAECATEPVYDAICRAAAEDERMLALLWEAPRGQQKPNLLLATVHDLVLTGTRHGLGAYFPSVGGERAVDESFVAALRDFLGAYDDGVRERLRTRSTQTNEIGRSAVLHPVLAHLAEARGADRLALLDFGASAGLNLGVDAYRYDYGRFTRGADPSADVPLVPCELRGERDLSRASLPTIVERRGLDVAPVDVNDAEAVRWLRACLWPHDVARAQRFDRAIALAKAHAWTVERTSEGTQAIERWLASLPAGMLPVVFHSWVLFYFGVDERARFGLEMERLVERHDAVWLAAEAETLRIGRREPPPRGPHPASTNWIACTRGDEGVRHELLARSHPHGKWLEWIAEPHARG